MILTSDEGNTTLATSRQFVDSLNAEFYSLYQYPWAPMSLDKFTDPHFEITMLNQSIGDWTDKIVPRNPKIWVAGCGTNQAAMTALRFPAASVLGSDLSPKSLEACSRLAGQVGATNLELKRESITDTGYTERFDFIKCTGVIHHTADPEATLACLAAALKPGGVMELMVYNRFHRTLISAFQKAVRILEDAAEKPDFQEELHIARHLLAAGAIHRSENETAEMLKRNDSHLADAVIQPVEYGYTVESLEAMADRCGLEYLAPCINQFDQVSGQWEWDLHFEDTELRTRYEGLPDSRRWQVTNLLSMEKSPMLWFYLQRKDAGRPGLSEQEMCNSFLSHTFRAAQTEREIFIRKGDRYERAPARRSYPTLHPDPLCRKVIECVRSDAPRPMAEILTQAGSEKTFYTVNRLRLMLTTPAFPYLQAIGL